VKTCFNERSGNVCRPRLLLTPDRMTIAETACFPYVAMAPNADVSLDEYPAVTARIGRFQALPGYIPAPALKKSWFQRRPRSPAVKSRYRVIEDADFPLRPRNRF